MTPPFALENLSLDVQASIGAVLFPTHGIDVDTLMQRADVAMYIAKQQGRNQVCHATLKPLDMVSREERDVLFNLFGSGSKLKAIFRQALKRQKYSEYRDTTE